MFKDKTAVLSSFGQSRCPFTACEKITELKLAELPDQHIYKKPLVRYERGAPKGYEKRPLSEIEFACKNFSDSNVPSPSVSVIDNLMWYLGIRSKLHAGSELFHQKKNDIEPILAGHVRIVLVTLHSTYKMNTRSHPLVAPCLIWLSKSLQGQFSFFFFFLINRPFIKVQW